MQRHGYREYGYWKRYRGGTAGDIWVDQKGSGTFENWETLKEISHALYGLQPIKLSLALTMKGLGTFIPVSPMAKSSHASPTTLITMSATNQAMEKPLFIMRGLTFLPWILPVVTVRKSTSPITAIDRAGRANFLLPNAFYKAMTFTPRAPTYPL